MFYNGQKELEMQYKMNKIIGQCRQKCEALHEKFTEKLEQVHTAYQKMAKRQKRKLDEMYDKLRSEYESAKRSSVQPANFFSRAEPDLFSSMANMMDGRASVGQDYLRRNVYIPGQKWRCCVQALCSASLDIYISTNIERTSTSVSMQMYRCKAALLCICIVIDNNMWKGKVTLHRRQARKAWLL
ncbi:hypothetical protein BHM03_00012686 [Ensete ventricosum]|nr:hypothetical protein BHM03_00012686 [Ensete ventricosum]